MTSSLWRSVRERLLMFPSESGWRSTMEVRDITTTSGPWGHSLAFIGKSSVLSKATSCHPGPAGGRFSKHTCSIPQDLCLALAHPQCPSQDQVRSRRCHTDICWAGRARAGTWRLLRGGVVPQCYDMDTIELESMASLRYVTVAGD